MAALLWMASDRSTGTLRTILNICGMIDAGVVHCLIAFYFRFNDKYSSIFVFKLVIFPWSQLLCMMCIRHNLWWSTPYGPKESASNRSAGMPLARKQCLPTDTYKIDATTEVAHQRSTRWAYNGIPETFCKQMPITSAFHPREGRFFPLKG